VTATPLDGPYRPCRDFRFREDDALIDAMAAAGIAYVPFFPLGGFTLLQSTALSDVATQFGAIPMQVALA
jgi:pyridoxine 4-dehydrogenase